MNAPTSPLSFLPAGAGALPSAGVAAPSASGAIALYARHTEGFEERVQATLDQLRQAALEHPGSIVQATSLGAEDMVLTDLIARAGLPIAVGTLQTGKLHAETLALIPAIERRYGRAVEVYSPPEEQVVHFVRRHGEDAMYQSIELRKACCQIRKLEPLGRMLAGRQAWVTGLRREQSANRGAVPLREVEANGRVKHNPLADWTWNDIWHYIATHDVPYNALHDQFMPSIGCAPCTRAIAVGEEFRAGRWWWEDEKAKECGLHVAQPTSADADRSSEAVAA
jgi:phosphoadenosine phosphosulfate reductase